MIRLLALCLVTAACGAPAARPAPLVAHSVAAPAPKAVVAAAEPEPEAEPPSWLEPTQPSRRVVTSTSITILDQIAFIGPSAQIDPVSYPMLDAVVATLDGNPSIRVMEIVVSGNDAPKRWQQELGDRRARMIMEYMIHKGADRARLRARGEAQAPQVSSFVILQRD
jgi:outer membrane protein OmpA-like peptidoglycan-associated protein